MGLLLTQIAKLRGARVLGDGLDEEKARLSREAGADETIDYTTQDFEAEVRRLTDGRGVQVVYDSVGKTTFEKGLACLAPRGTDGALRAVERPRRAVRSCRCSRSEAPSS